MNRFKASGEQCNAAPQAHTAASEAMPLWQAKARQQKSKVDGNCIRLPIRRQSDSEDRSNPNRLDTENRRRPIPQAAQLFKLQTRNVKFLWEGLREGYFFFKKRYPSLSPYPHAVRPLRTPCGKVAPLSGKRKQHPFAEYEKREHPFGCSLFNYATAAITACRTDR